MVIPCFKEFHWISEEGRGGARGRKGTGVTYVRGYIRAVQSVRGRERTFGQPNTSNENTKLTHTKLWDRVRVVQVSSMFPSSIWTGEGARGRKGTGETSE